MNPGLPKLTRRESEVLALLSEGLGDKQIGVNLGISEHTAGTHLRNIFLKLQVHSRTGAVSKFLRNPENYHERAMETA